MKLNLKIVAASAAVAMMSAGAAHAAVVTANPASAKYSLEGLELSGNTGVAIPTVIITLQQNLTYQDDLFITITGANTATLTPPTLDCTDANGINPVGTGFTTGYVPGGSTGNTWNFRVTDQQGATAGESCVVTGLTVTASSLAASKSANVSFTAKRFILNQVIDSGATENLAVVSSQFALAVTQPLNETIDVFADRLVFVNGGTQDVLTFQTEVKNALPVFPGTPFVDATATRATIMGEFYWVDGDGDGLCEAAEFAASIGEPATLTIFTGTGGSDCTKLVLDVVTPNGAADDTVDVYNVTFDLLHDIVLSPINYSIEVLFTYKLNGGSASSSKVIGQNAGAWGINGAQVYIQYMPYGEGVSRIIYAANEGGLDADVSLDWFDDEGNSGSIENFAMAPGHTVTQLSGAIDAALAADGFDGSGKVALRLTFTAPDTDIEVYSAYNVGGSDRGTVVNTSNGRTFFYGGGVAVLPPVN